MRFKELNEMDLAQLKEREVVLRKEIAMLHFEKASGKILDSSAPKRKRKDLARVLTRVSQVGKGI